MLTNKAITELLKSLLQKDDREEMCAEIHSFADAHSLKIDDFEDDDYDYDDDYEDDYEDEDYDEEDDDYSSEDYD